MAVNIPHDRQDSADSRGGRREGAAPLPTAAHEQWDRFVAECPDATLFHAAWWYRAWGEEPVVQAIADGQGRVQAGICYCLKHRWGATAIGRPPFTARNGPVFLRPENAPRHQSHTRDKKLLLQLIGALPRIGVYDFWLRPCDRDVMPFLWNGFDAQVAYTYVLPSAERGAGCNTPRRRSDGACGGPCARPPKRDSWSRKIRRSKTSWQCSPKRPTTKATHWTPFNGEYRTGGTKSANDRPASPISYATAMAIPPPPR